MSISGGKERSLSRSSCSDRDLSSSRLCSAILFTHQSQTAPSALRALQKKSFQRRPLSYCNMACLCSIPKRHVQPVSVMNVCLCHQAHQAVAAKMITQVRSELKRFQDLSAYSITLSVHSIYIYDICIMYRTYQAVCAFSMFATNLSHVVTFWNSSIPTQNREDSGLCKVRLSFTHLPCNKNHWLLCTSLPHTCFGSGRNPCQSCRSCNLYQVVLKLQPAIQRYSWIRRNETCLWQTSRSVPSQVQYSRWVCWGLWW